MTHTAPPTVTTMQDTAPHSPQPRRRRKDRRLLTTALVFAGIAVLGGVIHWLDNRQEAGTVLAQANQPPAPFEGLSATGPSVMPLAEVEPQYPAVALTDRPGNEAREIMQLAAKDIKARHYDDALRRLNDARAKLQSYPEAYLILGTALEGKKDFAAARDFYNAAIERDPYLSEAYWGYATTSERLGELHSAIGAMRNFLHTQASLDPDRLKVVQARSALWEWEAQLGRGPWGPSKGIPPGFTREELKRDGRGVGIKIPLPETRTPDGLMKYEIKHQKKFNHFKPD